MRSAVFLDRDGVLVGARVVGGVPRPDPHPSLLAGVADACRQLRAAGYVLVMVTNQPDIARGTVTKAAVDAVNDDLRRSLALDDVRVCAHDDDDGCTCRKPQPGMLVDASRDLDLDLSRSVTVGDRWRDIEAGHRAGTRTVFVDHGYVELRPDNPDVTVTSLYAAVPAIVRPQWEDGRHAFR